MPDAEDLPLDGREPPPRGRSNRRVTWATNASASVRRHHHRGHVFEYSADCTEDVGFQRDGAAARSREPRVTGEDVEASLA